MNERISIILPEETLHLIDYMGNKKNRSQFVDEAVKHYIEHIKKVNLREQLRQGAIERSERDLKLAREWNVLEEETWQRR